MKRLVEEAGMGEVIRFAGFVRPAEVPDYLALMDILLAPYPRIEPFYFAPLKVLEALAMGVPVLTSALGDLPRMVGAAGRTVPWNDLAAMADTLVEAADQPDLLAAWSRAGPSLVAGRTWEDVADRLVHLAVSAARSSPPQTLRRTGKGAARRSRAP